MKRKLIGMMLALTVITSVTACGNEKKEAGQHTVTKQEQVEKKEAKGNIEKNVKQVSEKKVGEAEETNDTEETQEFTKRLDQVEVTSYEGKSITLNVPEGYDWYIQDADDQGGCAFEREDGKETVFVMFSDRLLDVDEEFCDSDLTIPYYATGTESEVMTEEINGHTVYYKHIAYEYDEYNGHVSYETVKAMCEVGDDHMLTVETDGRSGQNADFYEIRGFFEF